VHGAPIGGGGGGGAIDGLHAGVLLASSATVRRARQLAAVPPKERKAWSGVPSRTSSGRAAGLRLTIAPPPPRCCARWVLDIPCNKARWGCRGLAAEEQQQESTRCADAAARDLRCAAQQLRAAGVRTTTVLVAAPQATEPVRRRGEEEEDMRTMAALI
jgi:hypothetical protein